MATSLVLQPVLAIFASILGAAVGLEELWFVGVEPFTGGVWDAAVSMRHGANIMLEEINNNPNILPGYELKMVWQDGECDETTGKLIFLENVFKDTYRAFAPGVAVKELDADGDGTIETEDVAQWEESWNSSIVTTKPFGLLTGCSGVSKQLADIAYIAHIPYVSNSATNPGLSDRSTYTNFFRTVLPDTFYVVTWVAIAKELGHSRITAVVGDTETWAVLAAAVASACETFGIEMVGNDMTGEIAGFYGTQIMQDADGLAAAAVEDLISFKVRMVAGLSYVARMTLALCQAAQQGFNNAIWMTMGWYAAEFWRDSGVVCSNDQMDAQAHGMITSNMVFYRADLDTILGCSESMTAGEFQTEFYARHGKAVGDLTPTGYGFVPRLEGATTGDAICMLAQMLHKLLYVEGFTVDDINERTDDIYNKAFELLEGTDFEGLQGKVSFDAGSADPKGDVIVQQVQHNSYIDIGLFNNPDWSFFESQLIFHFEGEVITTVAGATSLTGSPATFTECPTGTVINFTTNECQGCSANKEYVEATESCLCVVGYHSNDDGSCSPCAGGTYAATSGTVTCSQCEVGKYSSAGASTCEFCPLGRYSSSTGMSQCDACPSELYSTLAIASETSSDCVCGLGCYTSDASTSPVTCHSCPANSNTTSKNSQTPSACLCDTGMYMSEDFSECITCPSGSTTTGSGKVGVENCLCERGDYMPADHSGCLTCPTGMTCPQGSSAANTAYLGQSSFTETQVFPHLSERYWASRENPMSVFECRSEKRCPGGLPGRACASGLENQACEHCMERFFWDGEKCTECSDVEATKLLYPILPVVLVPIVMLILYKFFGDQFHLWGSFQNSITAVAFITLNHYQVISILGAANVAIPTSVTDVYNSYTFTTDASSLFKVECTGMSDFQTAMILKGVAPLILLFIAGAQWLLSRLIHRVFNRLPQLETNRWLNVLGSLLFTFFSAIAALSLVIFKCADNPNGKKSLATDLSVICFDSDDWKSMVGLGVCFVIVYIFGLGTIFVRAVLIAPRAFSDPAFQMRYKFLFIKFRAEAYWWALVFLAKNFFINLAMCIAVAGVAQLYLVMTVAVVYMMGCVTQLPYRSRFANFIEVLTGISIIYAASLLTWYADRGDSSIDTDINITTAVLSFYPLVAAIAGVIYLWRFGLRLPHTAEQRKRMAEAFQEIATVGEAISKLSPDAGTDMMLRLQEWDRWFIMKGAQITRIEVLGGKTKSRIVDKSLSSDMQSVLENEKERSQLSDLNREIANGTTRLILI